MAIWRIEACKAEAGYCSNSTIYNLIRDGLWTRSVRLGERSVGWPDNEVRTICAARIAGLSDDEMYPSGDPILNISTTAIARADDGINCCA